MALLEQTAGANEGAGDSRPILFDPSLEGEAQITIFTNWVTSLMASEDKGSLVACGNLDLISAEDDEEATQDVTIAGGFNSQKTEWTWSVDFHSPDSRVHLVSDVDLKKKTAGLEDDKYRFNLGRMGENLVAIPGEGQLNLPNLWQRVSAGHQGKLQRDHFVYDGGSIIAAYIRKAFIRNVFVHLEPLQLARESAQTAASTFEGGFISTKTVPYNAVGFRGSTGIRTLGFASPASYLDHATKGERVITVDQLPAFIGRTLNQADPVFDCPVAILDPESIHQTKITNIKDLAISVTD